MTQWRGKRVGVLMGGITKERPISLKTGKAVAAALRRRGYDIVEIDVGKDLQQQLAATKIDVAFIALHGKFGEDGCVQGMLEWLRIPYTGSGPLASAVAMHKAVCKRIAEQLGIRTPSHLVIREGHDNPEGVKQRISSLPVVVKPSREGSTINLTVVRKIADLRMAIETAFESDDTVLIEEYIAGKEVTVSLLNGEALPIVEIVPNKGLYDYESKYTKGMTEYIVPARLEPVVAQELSSWSKELFRSIDGDGFARADFIVTPEGKGYFLELNTIPGMTELSLVPMAAKAKGIEFDQLCELILDGAKLKVN